jgi:hypothetical protein
MESEGLLPWSFLPIHSRINPVYSPYSLFLRFIVLLSSHLHLGLPSSLFPLGLLTQITLCLSLRSHAFYITRFSIWSPSYCLARTTNVESPHCRILSSVPYIIFRSKHSPHYSVLKPLTWQTKYRIQTKQQAELYSVIFLIFADHSGRAA